MKKSILIFLAAIFLVSCNAIMQDSCYDMDGWRDPENKICSDDCVKQAGEAEFKTRTCKFEKDIAGETHNDTALEAYKSCLLSGDCPLPEDNQAIKVAYADAGRFTAAHKNGDLQIEITGEFNSDKTPFPEDERNWQAPHDWVRSLKIKISDTEVFLPISAYADLSPPKTVYYRQSNRDIFLMFKNNGEAAIFKLSPIICEGVNIGEFEITQRMKWYVPMYGDSVQYSKFRLPNCN